MNRRLMYTFTLALLMAVLFSVTASAAPYIYLPKAKVGAETDLEVEVFRADAPNAPEVSFTIKETTKIIDIAAGPQRQYIYVISDINGRPSTEGKLTIIDTKDSNKTLATIPFADEPVDVVVNPQTKKAYVLVKKKDSSDKIINGEINIITDFSHTSKIPVGKAPSAIAITYDGDIYVTNKGDNPAADNDTVTVIKNNVETSSSTTPITVGPEPDAVVISDDSKYIYVANSGNRTVSVIKGIDHSDYDDDGDEITVADENTVVATVTIPDTGRTLVDLAAINYKDGTGNYKNYIFALTTEGANSYIYKINTATNAIDGEPIEITAHLATTIATSANGSVDDAMFYLLSGTDNIARSYKINSPADTSSFTDTRSALSIVGTVPDAPTGLTVDENDTDYIRIEWNDTEGETGYKLERRNKSNDEGYKQIAVLGENAESYTDSNLPDNDDFDYRLRAFNDGANSFYSEALSTSTDEDDPSTCFIDSSSTNSGLGSAALLLMLAALAVAGSLSSRICLAFQKK